MTTQHGHKKIPSNYLEAIEGGWTEDHVARSKDYVSKRVNPYTQPCLLGQGRNKGLIYVETPSDEIGYGSVRVYLRKEGG